MRAIADRLGRAPSTISRGLRRNKPAGRAYAVLSAHGVSISPSIQCNTAAFISALIGVESAGSRCPPTLFITHLSVDWPGHWR
ncbi:helix-turn-helix domain-containing protein [Mycolicibacterium helvum]|uniref:helix-turn-helix domain-containing protein n=1 Tax=Mycolicibacterium helvum TaxID=1534349 RepID=UPI0038995DDC